MLKLDDDTRELKEIWNDYLGRMAQASWQETSDRPLRFDFGTAEIIKRSGNGGVWSILVDGERVGYVAWVKHIDLFTSEPYLTVVSLYLVPEARSYVNVIRLLRTVKLKAKEHAKYYVVSNSIRKTLCDRVWIREV